VKDGLYGCEVGMRKVRTSMRLVGGNLAGRWEEGQSAGSNRYQGGLQGKCRDAIWGRAASRGSSCMSLEKDVKMGMARTWTLENLFDDGRGHHQRTDFARCRMIGFLHYLEPPQGTYHRRGEVGSRTGGREGRITRLSSLSQTAANHRCF
jgi:hypothetical protein